MTNLIGCVQHDCAECKKREAELEILQTDVAAYKGMYEVAHNIRSALP